MLISRYLFLFCIWLAVSAALFYFFSDQYGVIVLVLSEFVLGFITTVDVNLDHIASIGITLTYPGIPQPMAFRFELFSVTLNLIFAIALVLTTLSGVELRYAVGKIVAALALMLLLHTYHVVMIILNFLTATPNPLIAPDFPRWLAVFIHWNYAFADKMGYTLFPFVAWFAVCFRNIMELFAPTTGATRTNP